MSCHVNCNQKPASEGDWRSSLSSLLKTEFIDQLHNIVKTERDREGDGERRSIKVLSDLIRCSLCSSRLFEVDVIS